MKTAALLDELAKAFLFTAWIAFASAAHGQKANEKQRRLNRSRKPQTVKRNMPGSADMPHKEYLGRSKKEPKRLNWSKKSHETNKGEHMKGKTPARFETTTSLKEKQRLYRLRKPCEKKVHWTEGRRSVTDSMGEATESSRTRAD